MSDLVVWVWWGVQCIDGVQDIVGEVGQMDDGVGHHRFSAGSARQQEWDGAVVEVGGYGFWTWSSCGHRVAWCE